MAIFITTLLDAFCCAHVAHADDEQGAAAFAEHVDGALECGGEAASASASLMHFADQQLEALALVMRQPAPERITEADYFYAGSAADFKKVYETLSSRLMVEKKDTEISALLALAAAVLAILSAGLSLLWFNRIL